MEAKAELVFHRRVYQCPSCGQIYACVAGEEGKYCRDCDKSNCPINLTEVREKILCPPCSNKTE